MIASVVVGLVIGLCAAACTFAWASHRSFKAWLAFRREGQKHDSEALADALKRLTEIEQRLAGAELQKLRR